MNQTEARVFHILVVGGGRILEDKLRKDGCAPVNALDITHVQTLVGAKQAILNKQYAAVVLDLQLPNGVGLATIGVLKEACAASGPGLPIIVMTDLVDEPVAAYFEAGADAFVDYSSSARQIAAVVYRACTHGVDVRRKSRQWRDMSAMVSHLEAVTDKLCPLEVAH